MNRALNKVEALAKGRKVKCTVSILNAKLADVLTIMSTEKDIKSHIYEELKEKNEH